MTKVQLSNNIPFPRERINTPHSNTPFVQQHKHACTHSTTTTITQTPMSLNTSQQYSQFRRAACKLPNPHPLPCVTYVKPRPAIQCALAKLCSRVVENSSIAECHSSVKRRKQKHTKQNISRIPFRHNSLVCVPDTHTHTAPVSQKLESVVCHKVSGQSCVLQTHTHKI